MASTSKKTSARRASKATAKTARKATTAKATANATRAVKDGATKITSVAKENPRREGTVQHKRFALLQKFAGKTIEAFMAGGGDRDCLRYAVATGNAKTA